MNLFPPIYFIHMYFVPMYNIYYIYKILKLLIKIINVSRSASIKEEAFFHAKYDNGKTIVPQMLIVYM